MTRIRVATVNDAAACRDIYAPYVSDSAISFELSPPTTATVRTRLSDTLETYPWLVCEHDGAVVGYAYAHEFRSREAYQWCVESSVYVDDAHQRAGVGRGLYESLFAVLRRQGFLDVYAGITLPNEPSVSAHEAFGFQRVGTYPDAGYKAGAWHDVSLWHRSLDTHENPPEPPTPFAEMREASRLREAVSAGEGTISLGAADEDGR